MKKTLLIVLLAALASRVDAGNTDIVRLAISDVKEAIAKGLPNLDNNIFVADMDIANLDTLVQNPSALHSFNFSNSDLSGANLSHLDLSNANLNGTNLTNANLTGANLSHADLRHANVSGANLTGANLSNALLDDVIITADTIIDNTTNIDADVIPTGVLALKKIRKELKKAQVTLAALKDDAKEGLDKAGETIKDGLEKAKDGLENAGVTIKDGVEAATENAKTGLEKAGETVKTHLKKAKKDFVELPHNTKKFFKKTGKKIREFFND